MDKKAHKLTIRKHISRMFGSDQPPEFPLWPPDVFAVTADMLQITSTYPKVVDIDKGHSFCPTPEHTRELGASWFKKLISSLEGEKRSKTQVEDLSQLEAYWDTLTSSDLILVPGGDLDDHIFAAIINLFLCADEASENISLTAKGNIFNAKLQMKIENLLSLKNKSLSLCQDIEADNLRVLPKSHTPDCGMTLRSLSHHLALVPNLEVQAIWVPSIYKQKDQINLLLIPWPLVLKPNLLKQIRGKMPDRAPDSVEMDYTFDKLSWGRCPSRHNHRPNAT